MDPAIRNGSAPKSCAPIPKSNKRWKKRSGIKTEEESYREGETAHFYLKYNGSATPDLAPGIFARWKMISRISNRSSIIHRRSTSRDPVYARRLRTSRARRAG